VTYRLVDRKHAGLIIKLKELVKVELTQTIDDTRHKPDLGFKLVCKFAGVKPKKAIAY
jgi:hypothetical protein